MELLGQYLAGSYVKRPETQAKGRGIWRQGKIFVRGILEQRIGLDTVRFILVFPSQVFVVLFGQCDEALRQIALASGTANAGAVEVTNQSLGQQFVLAEEERCADAVALFRAERGQFPGGFRLVG